MRRMELSIHEKPERV